MTLDRSTSFRTPTRRNWNFTALLVAGSLAAATTVEAATLLFDDFESYATTADLNAVWPVGVGTDTATFLDAGPAGSTNLSKTVHVTNRNTRRDRIFSAPAATLFEPIVLTLDIYYAGDTGASEYVQLLSNNSSNALSQLISIGFTSLATTNGANNPANFQARVAFGSVNWINLNTARTVGWHTFTAEIFPATINFYVDGILDTGNVAYTGGVGDTFSTVRLGSGLGARAEQGYYDNVSISSVPEPGSVALLAVGLAAVSRRRRNQASC